MSSSEEFASADEDVQGAERSQKKVLSQKKSAEKGPQGEKTGGVRKLGKPSSGSPTKAKPSKLGQQTADTTKPVETPDQPPSPKRPPNVEACWEFESWEEYDKQEKEKEAKQKTSTDGWDDDDDWEQPTNSDANESPKRLPGRGNNNQPVEDISSSKSNEPQDVSKVLDKLTLGGGGGEQPKGQSGGWGWNSWGGGISSFLSTATESVATLTSHVSHGLSTVIESGMGVPDPAEMARQDHGEERRKRESDPDIPSSDRSPTEASNKSSSGLNSFVSGVTQISSKVITGGLDTLEGIGKKTMNILQENDPGLLNKRKLLGLDGGDRPVLSHMLREAKVKSEEKERNMKQLQKSLYKRQLHFETLFDDYCGLVHLEALEMLSKQSTLKLESLMAPLSGKALKELQETMTEVRELCELPDEGDEADGTHAAEELQTRLAAAFEDLETKVDLQELVDVWQKDIRFLETDNPRSAQELYDRALRSLAQTTAIAVNKMHKLAELLLVQEHHSTVNEADSLVQLTGVLCWHLGGIAARFGSTLSDETLFVIADDEDVNGLITSIFLEGTNSTSYIQNAFQLFLPVLQLGAA